MDETSLLCFGEIVPGLAIANYFLKTELSLSGNTVAKFEGVASVFLHM